ncbi:MAG: dTDP-glucose 4,6-dehydratase [Candidatus Shapirobacteria bacterium]|nr:dTDP-glucose 4,6-dehydratase [Candidatus Shapirobacteria bacterium]
MKILVTGGSGFIGSTFIHYWLTRHPDDSIINFDKLTYAANPESLSDLTANPHYQFVQGDICDEIAVDKLFSDTIDLIIHFAAESHVDRSIDDPMLFVKTNVLGTYTLLSAAKKHGNIRFHHISTDEVFGTIIPGVVDVFSESTPYNPSSPYSASKASADHFVRSFGKTYGLPITITNCSNNYGPFMNPEKMIPRMITNLIDGKKVPIYGAGENYRDWLYVTDHCSAIEAVILNGKLGQTYCVGGLKETSRNIDLVKQIIKLMNKSEDQIEFVADRPAHDNYAVNWDKVHNELGWEPKETLTSGLQKTIDWYQTHESWWRAAKTEAEAFYQRLNAARNK